MDDKELHQYCVAWVEWCRTRRYYCTPKQKNILARLQPSASGEVPDAPNSADMQYFNMAIHTLAEMSEHKTQFACFSFCYLEGRRGVKVKAASLNICRKTYYNHVAAFARRAWSMSLSLKSAQAAMRAHLANEAHRGSARSELGVVD
jgi:hypothetical protein